MPGEFNDMIPLPRRNPRRRFEPTPLEQILAEAEDALFDADDVSFITPAPESQRAVQTPFDVILHGPAEEEGPIGPPQPTTLFGAPEASPEQEARAASPTLADRLLNSVAKGANRAIEEGGPIGLDPENVASFREMGLFNRDPDNPSLLGTANEVLIGGGAALADLGLRGLAAVGEGGISGIGQAARELGASQGQAKRLERDIRAGLTAFGVAGAAAPVAAAGLSTAARVRRMKPPPFRPRPLRRQMRLTSSVEDFKREINDVLETGESSVGLVARSDFGPITIDLGVRGRGPKFRSGFGLSKIIAKRTEVDGIDGERFVRERLPEVLARGKLKLFQFPDKSRRAVIDFGRDRAILALFRDNEDRETWVLNAFEKFEE